MLSLVKLKLEMIKMETLVLLLEEKSFHEDQLLKNYYTILNTLEKEKGNLTLKGDLIKNTFVTSSMGVSYKVKLGKTI